MPEEKDDEVSIPISIPEKSEPESEKIEETPKKEEKSSWSFFSSAPKASDFKDEETENV